MTNAQIPYTLRADIEAGETHRFTFTPMFPSRLISLEMYPECADQTFELVSVVSGLQEYLGNPIPLAARLARGLPQLVPALQDVYLYVRHTSATRRRFVALLMIENARREGEP